MSYRYYMLKKGPVSAWMLDDPIPFFDCTGFGAFGDKTAATSAPTITAPLVAGAVNAKVFSSTRVAQFKCNLFKQGLERRQFVLEAWVFPIEKGSTLGNQQILSHDGIYDGLSINGTVLKFSTQYLTTGEASCTFDLGLYRAAHVVGIHTETENQLWVNGEFVSSVSITEEQQADTYVATDDFLYMGNTASTQSLAANGVAFYPSLSGEQIISNYQDGISTVPQDTVSAQFDGVDMDLYASQSNKFLEYDWSNREDFKQGLNGGVQYADDRIVPIQWSGTSEAGTWTASIQLDLQGDTSIYGVYVEWTGTGITVESSLNNGVGWSPVVNRRLVNGITPGYNPTDKNLDIRVTFAGGVVNDPASLNSLKIIGFKDHNLENLTERDVSVGYPGVLRENHEPTLYRSDNGVYLNGGTLTIGEDPTGDPDEASRTIELWVNNRSATAPVVTANSLGELTTYKNGVATPTLTVVRGEWTLVHYAYAGNITDDITISGNCIIGRVVLYPTNLTATEIDTIWKSYTGTPVISINDSGSVNISEPATPVSIYAHDWSIDAAG